jgi:hypothetical protein
MNHRIAPTRMSNLHSGLARLERREVLVAHTGVVGVLLEAVGEGALVVGTRTTGGGGAVVQRSSGGGGLGGRGGGGFFAAAEHGAHSFAG